MPGTIVAPADADPARLDEADGRAASGGLKFRRDIEGLRAVAVLMVVFSHLGFPGFASGFVGVDVFFVISGYLITSLLAKEYRRRAEASASGRGRISIAGFYRRRVLRILPAALTTIAVVLLAGKLLLNRIAFIKLQSEALWATFFGTNIQLIRQATDYFQVNVAQSPLQNFWSLAVEEQFYVVWPLVFLVVALVAGRRRDGSGWLGAVRAAVVVIGLASLAWSIRSAEVDPAAGYFSTFARAWQLALGAFIALTPAIATRMKGRVATVSGLLGLALLALALVVCGAEQGYPGYIALVPTGGAALLICAGLSETARNPAGRLLSMRLPRAIGRISYSLYLWHWPLIIFAGVLYGKESTTAGARVGLLALSFAVATVSYFAIERPFIRLAHRPKQSVGEDSRVEAEGESRDSSLGQGDREPVAPSESQGDRPEPDRPETDRRRRIPKLQVAGMFAITAFSITTIAALARPLPYADGILPPPGPEMSKARWERELNAAVKQKTVSKREALIAEAMATRQLRGNIGERGVTARSANRGGGRCTSRMTILNLEQARRCSRYGLGYGNFSWPKGAKPLVALVGNSFAGQWFYQLQRLLPKNVKLMPMGITGCRPWETGETGRLDSHGNSCDEHRNFVIRALRTEKPGLTVVSYQRVHPHQQQAAATGPYISRIDRWSQRVLFLGPSPILIPLGTCLATSRQLSACNRRLKPSDWQLDRQDQGIVESVGADYLSVQRLVCTWSVCPAFVADKPTRHDGIHLSRWTTRGISGFVSDALRKSARRASASPAAASATSG